MSEIKIKICGLSREQDIEYVNEALPDFIGLVFAKSRRQVSPDKAADLKSLLDNRIKAVGVFVNEDIRVITALCQQGIIDYIQLHGDESLQYLSDLKSELVKVGGTKPVIKAIRVNTAESLNMAEQYNSDFLLLDTYNNSEYGGTGKTFDWRLSQNISKPFFLAGGLTSKNIIPAIHITRPFCLDVSSGVETNGFKDRKKIIEIIKLVRSVK